MQEIYKEYPALRVGIGLAKRFGPSLARYADRKMKEKGGRQPSNQPPTY